MQFHFDISSNINKPKDPPFQPPVPVPPPSSGDVLIDTLRQMMDMQRDQFQQIHQVLNEHLAHSRQVQAEHMARWKNLMGRWEKQFPELAQHCKKVYPILEKAYVRMIDSMVDDLVQEGDEVFDSEYAVMDYLDRHGMRLGQFYHLLTIVGPLSETVNQNEAREGLE